MAYNEDGKKSRISKKKNVRKYKASKGADFDDAGTGNSYTTKSIKTKTKYDKKGEIKKIKRVKKTKGGGTMVTVSKQGLETNPMAPKGAKGLVTTRERKNKKFGASAKFPEIKEKNEGKFTAWVEKNMGGMDTCKAASKVMRSRTKKYSPAVVKMANYANNFGCKNKKDDGASVPLKGKQKNLPDALKSKILASDGASIKTPKQRRISEKKYNRKIAKADKSKIKQTAQSSVAPGERTYHGTMEERSSTKSTVVPNKRGTKNFVKETTRTSTYDPQWEMDLENSSKRRYYKQRTKK